MILPGSFSALQSAVAADAAKRNNLTEEEKQMIRSLLEGSGLSYNPTPEPQESDAVDTRSGKKTSTLGPVTVTAEREPQLPQVPPSTELIPPKYTDLPSDEAQDNMRVLSTGPGYNIVQKKDGSVEQNEGTVAARANNPGNLISGSLSDKYGAVGQDANRFAVFPNKKAGMDALTEWWSVKHKDDRIGDAMQTYAPPAENDTTGYTEFLTRGFDKNSTFDKLNPKQKKDLVNRIAQFEGSNKPVQKTVGLKPFSASNPPQDSEVSKLPLTAEQLRAAKRYRDGQQGLRNDAANAYEEFMNKKVPATETASTKTQVSPEETGLSTPVIKGEPYKEEAYTPPARHEEPAQGFEDSNSIAMGPTGKGKAKAPAAKAPTAKKPATAESDTTEQKVNKTNYNVLIDREKNVRSMEDSLEKEMFNYDKLKSFQNQYNRLSDEEKKTAKPENVQFPAPKKSRKPGGQAPANPNGSGGATPAGSSGGSSSMLPKTFQQLQIQNNIANTAQGSGESLADLQNTDVSGNKQQLTFAPGATYGPTDTNSEALRSRYKKVGDVANPVFYNKVTAPVGVAGEAPRGTSSMYGRRPAPTARQGERYNPVVFNAATGKWEEHDGVDNSIVLRSADNIWEFRNAVDESNPNTMAAIGDIDVAFNASAVDWNPDPATGESPSGDMIVTVSTPDTPLYGKRFRLLPETMHVNDTMPEIQESPANGVLKSGMPTAVSNISGDWIPVAPMFAKNNDWYKTILVQQQRATLQELATSGITPEKVSKAMENPLEGIDTIDTRDIEKKISGAQELRKQHLKNVYNLEIIDADGTTKNISPLHQYLSMMGKVQDNPVAATPQKIDPKDIAGMLGAIGPKTIRRRGVSVEVGGGRSSSNADVREAGDSPMTMVGKSEIHADIEMKRSLERMGAGYGITKDSVPAVRKILSSSGKWASIASNNEPFSAQEKVDVLKEIDRSSGFGYFKSGVSDVQAASQMLEDANPASLLEQGRDFANLRKPEKDDYINKLVLAGKIFNAFSDEEHQIGPIHTIQAHSMAVKPDIEMPKSFGAQSEQAAPHMQVTVQPPPNNGGNNNSIVPGGPIQVTAPNGNVITGVTLKDIDVSIDQNSVPDQTTPEQYLASKDEAAGKRWKNGSADWSAKMKTAKDKLQADLTTKLNAMNPTDRANYAHAFARTVLRTAADDLVQGMKAVNMKAPNTYTTDSMFNKVYQTVFAGLPQSTVESLARKAYPSMDLARLKKVLINNEITPGEEVSVFKGDNVDKIKSEIFRQFTGMGEGKQIMEDISGAGGKKPFGRGPFSHNQGSYAWAYAQGLKTTFGLDVASYTNADASNKGNWTSEYFTGIHRDNVQSVLSDSERLRVTSTMMKFLVP